jgi:GNAT superfamily N-acetyltransferase
MGRMMEKIRRKCSMDRVQTATKHDLPEVIKLINTVFISDRPESSRMEEKFPIFLSEANLDHIFIVADQEKTVSHAAYYPSKVLIQGIPIHVGSVGSVCTDAAYRGQGIASRILDALEDQARSEGIQVLFISGERGLYLRRKCKQVGGFKEFMLNRSQAAETLPPNVELRESDAGCILGMATVYNQEPVRFYRTAVEFEQLLKAGLLPFFTSTNKAYVLTAGGRIVAYFVLGSSNDQTRRGSIVEYAGDRQLLRSAFDQVLHREALDHLTVQVPGFDPLTAFLEHGSINAQIIHQVGTVKIINLASLMESLRPYFLQYTSLQTLDAIRWGEENDEKYYLRVGDETGEIGDLTDLTQLVFGFAENNTCLEKFARFQASHPVVDEFVRAVFPVPLPWAGNMNFI